jgi:hypothetical protein
MSLLVKYGTADNMIDITPILYEKFRKNNIIFIPKDDSIRADCFSDPAYGVIKSIFISDKYNTTENEYTHFSDIYIDIKNDRNIIYVNKNTPDNIKKLFPSDLSYDKIKSLYSENDQNQNKTIHISEKIFKYIKEYQGDQAEQSNNVGEQKIIYLTSGGEINEIEGFNNKNIIKKITNPERPTICFATMCKNEEHCIQETLESVYRYIDYWVVHDNGSTDRTCEIVINFFKEKNIPGEIVIDKWYGFDYNKTLMFEKCYGKTDYVLHIDADDLLCGDFKFTNDDVGFLKYCIETKRGSASYKCSVLYDNNVRWKICSVAHTIIRYLDNPENLKDSTDFKCDCYCMSRDTGTRAQDPEKYLKDALRLKDQFFRTLIEDPDGLNIRSVFYTAQSYFDQNMFKEACQWYSLYTKLKDNWLEEVFESNLRILRCYVELDFPKNKIIDQANKTISIFEDRAEPYLFIGRYLNNIGSYILAYN